MTSEGIKSFQSRTTADIAESEKMNCRTLISCANCTSNVFCVWTPEPRFPCRNGFDDTDGVAYHSCDVARNFGVDLGLEETTQQPQHFPTTVDSTNWHAIIFATLAVVMVVSCIVVAYKQRQESQRRLRQQLLWEKNMWSIATDSSDVQMEPMDSNGHPAQNV